MYQLEHVDTIMSTNGEVVVIKIRIYILREDAISNFIVLRPIQTLVNPLVPDVLFILNSFAYSCSFAAGIRSFAAGIRKANQSKVDIRH